MGSVVEVTEMESKRGTQLRDLEKGKKKSPLPLRHALTTQEKEKDGLFVLAG